MDMLSDLIAQYRQSLGRLIEKRGQMERELAQRYDEGLEKRYCLLCREEGETRLAILQMMRSREGNIRL